MKNKISELELWHALYQKGEIEKAKKGYLAFLKKHPQQAEALHALALIEVEEKKLSEATEHLEKAILYQPGNPTYQLHLANILKMQGLFNQAVTLLAKTVREHPDYAPAFNNLGTLYYAQGKFLEATQAYQQALEKEPHYIDAYYNLGLALTKQEKLEQAATAYEQVLAQSPGHAAARYQLATLYMRQEKWTAATPLLLELALTHPAHLETLVNLASCYLKQGAWKEARQYYLKALAQNPQDAQVLFNLGSLCAQQNQPEEAIRYYQELLKLNPDHFAAHNNLGVVYFAKKQLEPALQHLQEALRIQPQNTAISQLIAVLKKDPTLLISPPEYLRSLFDYYADHYEPHLLNTLDYQVPQILLRVFEKSRKQMNKKLDILDLGCGTGLCGEVFKFHAARLVGVDLSSKMLALAAEKNIYDELICEDLLSYLAKQEAAFDLILAGDVFVYLGDLTSTFQTARQALRSQGLLLFNTEISTQTDFLLLPSGRFAHRESYIKILSETNKLDIISQQRAVTRLQDNQPVSGLIYLLQTSLT